MWNEGPEGVFDPAFDDAVARHDARIAALGLSIWVGSESTFTDREAQSPEWLNQALGGEKERRAGNLAQALQGLFPGSVMLHTVGRQYPGEDRPRWNLGVYRRRDGQPVWTLDESDGQRPRPGLDALAAALGAELEARGWFVTQVSGAEAAKRCLLLRTDPTVALPGAADPCLARASTHAVATPAGGLRDELAEAGVHLFVLSLAEGSHRPRIELPMFGDVATFLAVLACIARAAAASGSSEPLLTGYPPPVDATVAWTTVTPDPAVIEINSAPSVDARDFLARSRAIYGAAAEEGLSPYRLYYNGAVADSGGGGQITLGGPSPESSPFLIEGHLLPRLVRFFNRHPALSYLYSHDYVGGGGQSVRPDERGTDAFDELRLALDLMARQDELPPQLLWHSLASFLCDASGNSHRAEMNIEKLWNPFLGARGMQGLVEFRALRMQHTPERATALACLLRAVVAILARGRYTLPLMDWGRELHARFALPFYLEQDMEAVLKTLDSAGLGLDAPLREQLQADEFRAWGRLELPGCILEVRRALEFWPLLGDAASPEQSGGSRLVDASTARVELRLRPHGANHPDWNDWELLVAGVPLPMRWERDGRGPLKVFGLRYRSFVPGWGLHPSLGVQTPIQLLLRHPDLSVDHRVTLHEWRPDGGGYEGLPKDLEEARGRREERVTLEVLPRPPAPDSRSGPIPGLDPFCLDLRSLAD